MRANMPLQLTRFIGREREIGDVRRLLEETRLLTLSGPGGCGKTRLAAAVAAQVLDAYQDGVAWVDLASVADESLVAQTVARSLRVGEQTGRSMSEALADFLIERHLLLLLDNCEHLIAACARLVSDLLSACPDLHVLTTSREPLALAGERVYPVPALSLPSAELLAGNEITPDVLEALSRYEAVTLFLDRARTVVPRFTLTAENAPAVADICIRLDGVPLAIELAAARVNVLTAGQIAARLDNRFALLSSDKRDMIDQRHQTLRAAIDWSYDLLTPQEQIILQRLSVFAGGCSLATAEAVCPTETEEQEQLLALLSSLVKKSLVVAETVQRSEARYFLLETIRQYGQDKLEEAGEWAHICDRHLRCFLRLVEETEPKLKGEYQQLWLNWLEGEYDNIRVALRWSVKSSQIEQGLRIAIALYQFWTIRDYAEEGLTWLARLLVQANEDIAAVVRASALCYAVTMAEFRGDREAQLAYGRDATALAESIGDTDKDALRWALAAQSFIARKAGDHQTAYTLARRLIQLHRELGDTYQLSIALSTSSFAAMSLGKYDEARDLLNEALPLLREMGNPYRIAMALNFSGDLSRCRQDYAAAVAVYEESIALLREIDAVRDLASALHNLGHTCLHLGDVERATVLFKQSMAFHQEQGNRPGMTESLLGFAALAVVTGLPAVGACLLAAAATIGGRHVTSEWAATSMEYEHYLNRARAGLSRSAYASAQTTGQNLSLEQAVALAEDVPRKAAVAQQRRRQLDQLTPREREVASLIAQTKSNDDIAAELVISKRTVETHITRIRAKLGFNERTQIVRWAIAAGLVPIDDQIHL